MKPLTRPEHLRLALASPRSVHAIRAGDSITSPRVDLVIVVPSGTAALIDRVEDGGVTGAGTLLKRALSSH